MQEALIFLSGILLGFVIGALGTAHYFKNKLFSGDLTGSSGSAADIVDDVVDSEEGEDVDPDQMIEAAMGMMNQISEGSAEEGDQSEKED